MLRFFADLKVDFAIMRIAVPVSNQVNQKLLSLDVSILSLLYLTKP